MDAPASMKVPLRDLPASRALDLPSAFVREALEGLPLRAALERPADDPAAGAARAELELHGDESDHVFARGSLRGWLEVACSRCVDPARVAFDEQLAVTYLPKTALDEHVAIEQEDADPELGVQLTEDDLDLYGYEGEEIDLGVLLREQIILAVPYAPLCRPDCKGLCPQCGANKNRETCACAPPIDPRLAALRNIELGSHADTDAGADSGTGAPDAPGAPPRRRGRKN